MSKCFVFLALFLALPAGYIAPRVAEQNNTDGTCTTNDDCMGRKVCNIKNNRCVMVKCIEDSDCMPSKIHRMDTYRDMTRGQRTGKFCFLYKCKASLPSKATCFKDSWCTSGMCKNGKCAKGKTGKSGYH